MQTPRPSPQSQSFSRSSLHRAWARAFPLQPRKLPTAFVVQALEQPAGLAPGTSTFLKPSAFTGPTPFRALRRLPFESSPRDWPKEHCSHRLPSFQVVSPPAACTALAGWTSRLHRLLSARSKQLLNHFTLLPKLRIHFADFPYLHCSID